MSHLLLNRSGRALLRFPLDGDETSIGRSPLADLLVEDAGVAPIQAVLVEGQDAGHTLRDGSGAGTVVNGRLVQEAPLADGDELELGAFRAHYVDGERRKRNRRPEHGRGGTWDGGRYTSSYDGMLIASIALGEIIIRLDTDRRFREPMTFVGEAGVGKSRLVRAANRQARGFYHRLAVVNCCAVPPDRVEAELEAAGALRPSLSDFPVIEEAQCLPLDLQARLAAALRCPPRAYFSFRESPAVHQAAGRLHRDLFLRLANVYLVPPLRERGADVLGTFEPMLAALSPGEPPALDPAARERLALHRWPGNLRELKNVVQRLLLAGVGPTIHAHDLPLEPLPVRASA